MTDIAFYHLQRSTLDQTLPKLVDKTLGAGKRAVVMARSEARVEALAGTLWTHAPESWLPHGTAKDGAAAEQPVWLTMSDENPNGATFLFLTDGAESQATSDYERCFDMFDGNDDSAVEAARVRWKAYKEAGHDLTYWQQTDRGGWEKKA